MNTHPESRFMRMQRGQAMTEYWPTIPAAIAVLVGAGFLVQFIVGSFSQTADALNNCITTEEVAGPDNFSSNGHSVQTNSTTYDADNNRTTFSFQVTSGGDHAISHWTLGLPLEFQNYVVAISDGDNTNPTTEWGFDPTTGITGLKFDDGYSGNGGGNNNNDPTNHEVQFCTYNLNLTYGQTFNIRDYVEYKDNNLQSQPVDWSQVSFVYTGAGANDPTNPPDWHLNDYNNGNSVTVSAADDAPGLGNHGDGEYRIYIVRNGEPQFDDHMTVRVSSDPDNNLVDAMCSTQSNGNGNGNGNSNGNNGNGNGRPRAIPENITKARYTPLSSEVRIVTVTLSGQYEFGTVDLAIKAGNEFWVGDITAPITRIDNQNNNGESNNSGGSSGGNDHNSCLNN
ncbi:MAG: hypothetical protein D6737_06000 [Chloroflexi bacterium]|nr:MAG: hypothetical protein D6737_06000 [Chloroflexota bacterium]